MLSSLFARSVLVACGLLWPAYRSFKLFRQRASAVSPRRSIDTNGTVLYDMETAHMWDDVVKHYSIMAVYMVAEWPADLFLFWLPFYDEFKLAFVLWLCLPQTKGSVLLYEQILEPFLVQHEQQVDKTIAELQQELIRRGSLYGSGLIRTSKVIVLELFMKLLNALSANSRTTQLNTQGGWLPPFEAGQQISGMSTEMSVSATSATVSLWQRLVSSIDPSRVAELAQIMLPTEMNVNEVTQQSTYGKDTITSNGNRNRETLSIIDGNTLSDTSIATGDESSRASIMTRSKTRKNHTINPDSFGRTSQLHQPTSATSTAVAKSSRIHSRERIASHTLPSLSSSRITEITEEHDHVNRSQKSNSCAPNARYTASSVLPSLATPLTAQSSSTVIVDERANLLAIASKEIHDLAAETVNYDDYDVVQYDEYSDLKSDIRKRSHGRGPRQ